MDLLPEDGTKGRKSSENSWGGKSYKRTPLWSGKEIPEGRTES